MQNHINNPTVHAKACRMLANLSSNDIFKQTIVDAGGIASAGKATKNHKNYTTVLAKACRVLEICHSRIMSSRKLLSVLVTLGVVLETMKNHIKNNPTVLAKACRVLGKMTYIEIYVKAIVDASGIASAGKAMQNHKNNPTVQAKACTVLANLLYHDVFKKAIVDAGGIALAIKAIQNHAHNSNGHANACRVLANLSSKNDIFKKAFVDAGDITSVVKASTKNHPTVQAKMFEVFFSNMAYIEINKEAIAMQHHNHKNNPTVQERCVKYWQI